MRKYTPKRGVRMRYPILASLIQERGTYFVGQYEIGAAVYLQYLSGGR